MASACSNCLAAIAARENHSRLGLGGLTVVGRGAARRVRGDRLGPGLRQRVGDLVRRVVKEAPVNVQSRVPFLDVLRGGVVMRLPRGSVHVPTRAAIDAPSPWRVILPPRREREARGSTARLAGHPPPSRPAPPAAGRSAPEALTGFASAAGAEGRERASSREALVVSRNVGVEHGLLCSRKVDRGTIAAATLAFAAEIVAGRC